MLWCLVSDNRSLIFSLHPNLPLCYTLQLVYKARVHLHCTTEGSICLEIEQDLHSQDNMGNVTFNFIFIVGNMSFYDVDSLVL